MRLNKYLNELSSIYGKGITFIDIDETLYKTFAKIYVVDDITKRVVKKLNNQEFNTYELPPNHSFDFREFRNAKYFRETSIPIEKTMKRLKRMFQNIDRRGSKVILLTARATFNNMHEFEQTFRDHKIPIDNIEVIFVGDRPNKRAVTTSQAKKNEVMKHLKTGEYRRIRLIDDDLKNIKDFLTLEKELPKDVIDNVKQKHNIPEDEDFPVIEFFGLLVKPDGSLKKIK